jgi:hypothetical protein
MHRILNRKKKIPEEKEWGVQGLRLSMKIQEEEMIRKKLKMRR